MASLMPDPPQQAAEVAHRHFDALLRDKAARLPALRDATGPVTLTSPHQVFTLTVTDLAADRGLEAAQASGWRYLVQEKDKPIALAEVLQAPASQQHVFHGLNQGRFVGSTAEAMRAVLHNPAATQGNFEIRVLDVPALYVRALWLHAASGAGDLLVPLAPSPVTTPLGQPVPAAQFLKELSSKAKAIPTAAGPSGG